MDRRFPEGSQANPANESARSYSANPVAAPERRRAITTRSRRRFSRPTDEGRGDRDAAHSRRDSFFSDIRTCKRLVVDGMVDATLHRCEEFGIGGRAAPSRAKPEPRTPKAADASRANCL